jgi:phenylalanine-4-hydroxylase
LLLTIIFPPEQAGFFLLKNSFMKEKLKIPIDCRNDAPLQQVWENYTEEDHAVWKVLFDRQLENLAEKAWSSYLACIPRTGIFGNSVPDFSGIENSLAQSTGWKIEVVKGIIPVGEFLSLLSRKRFCSSTWLRQRHQLDYLEEPDMFHDTFGHIPLLADKKYARFVEEFANLGLRFAHHEKAALLLERLYWFTIEFGLMKEAGKLKIYGAGILSSFGESNHIYSDRVSLRDFSVRDILLTPFRNDEVQNLYFVVNDMNDLWSCLPEAEKMLRDFTDGKISEEEFRFEEQLGSAK